MGSLNIKKIINYVGWLSDHNLGDEALYLITKKFFSSYRLVPYNSYKFLNPHSNPLITHIGDQGSRVVLFGGGTILPDDITWVKPGKYNYVFGAGVKNPVFGDPRHINLDKVVLARLRKFKFRLIGVRGDISRKLLKEWGIDSEVIGDPCLSFQPSFTGKKNCRKIAVNVGSDGLVWGGSQEKVVEPIIKVCKKLINHNYQLILVPFNKKDLPQIARISEATDIEIFNRWFDVNAVIDLISSCGVLIGERLHSLVFSAAAYTPFISLEYRPKCFEFARSVGFARYCVRVDKMTPEIIMRLFNDLIDNYDYMRNELIRKVEMYRLKQKEFAHRIVSDIEALPDDKWLAPTLFKKNILKLFWDSDVVLRRNAGKVWPIYNRLVFLRIQHLLI